MADTKWESYAAKKRDPTARITGTDRDATRLGLNKENNVRERLDAILAHIIIRGPMDELPTLTRPSPAGQTAALDFHPVLPSLSSINHYRNLQLEFRESYLIIKKQEEKRQKKEDPQFESGQLNELINRAKKYLSVEGFQRHFHQVIEPTSTRASRPVGAKKGGTARPKKAKAKQAEVEDMEDTEEDFSEDDEHNAHTEDVDRFPSTGKKLISQAPPFAEWASFIYRHRKAGHTTASLILP